MELEAVSCGYAVGTVLSGAGRVETVFKRAINIRLKSSMCLSLVGGDIDCAPNRIVLSTTDFAKLAIMPGEPVWITRDTVWHSNFSLGFRPGALIDWEIQPPIVCTLSVLTSALATGRGACLNYLGKRQGDLLEREVVRQTRVLERDWAAGFNLVGLGGGFTPAGDDVLLGFCVTASRLGWLDKEWHRELVECAFTESTSLSATGLYFAGQGQVQGRLDLVLKNLRREALFDACRQLVDTVGSTSGSDMLLGVLAACRYHLLQE